MKSKQQKQQDLAEKRAKEKRETTSIRLSSSERAIVEKKAEAKGMKTSAYIGYAAVHGCDGLSPEIMMKIQNFTNHAAAAVEHYDPKTAEEIRMEGNALWDLLS